MYLFLGHQAWVSYDLRPKIQCSEETRNVPSWRWHSCGWQPTTSITTQNTEYIVTDAKEKSEAGSTPGLLF